ncbi:MAG: hypothetical protein BWY89_01022 [Bacteroidetes bacterium ADurb.BinA012]|jgi:hypothetical protein|nr:MAG: hypothetical protein BWY89_01022 [Bacteroidetes bacterium ADurb.BinA012]HPH73909.1 DUF6089 family protein [Bacteroidales bacterium]
MKRSIIITLLIILALPALPQRNADYGVSAGVVNYLGEQNPLNAFFKPGPAVQLFYRYNFNPRQAVRANLLSGYMTPLGSLLGELGATYEFNFYPYSTFSSRRIDYSPYIAGGAAFSLMSKAGPFLSIPFSAGFKVNVANQVGVEIEYGFRKTFTDKLDGQSYITDPGGEPVDGTWTHNNDWYSFLGVSVTWKMYNRLAGCPAFAEMEKDKKRKRR